MSYPEGIQTCGRLSDLLDKGDSLVGDTSIPLVRWLAAQFFIAGKCTSVADQRHLTEALGLDEIPRPPRKRGPQVAPMLAHMAARATAGRRRKA